jgi:lipopolysaccharide/colanic/teichoic acid biosynthesis glycosyltransferase
MFSHQKLTLMIGDFAACIGAFYLMSALRFSTFLSRTSSQFKLFAILFVLWLIIFFIFDLYTARRINPNPRNIGLIIAAMATNTLLGVVFFYLTSASGISPKTNLVIVSVCSTILIIFWRRACYLLFTKRFVRKIILIGQSAYLTELADELAANPNMGTIVGIYPTIADAPTTVRVDIVIADGIDPQTLLAYARRCTAQPLSIFEAYELILTKIPIELMTQERALSYLNSRATSALYIMYRLFEIIGASVVLIITFPFMLIGAVAKWAEDGGPIFIKQHRVGKHGKLFTIYKLRSMQALNKDGSAETNGAVWATAKDPRITPVGHILRTTHLDEVPQMYNIIKGDLALIGPRAERPEFVAELEQQIPYYYLRHTIKPGFTGWAQIKYRYARSIQDSREKFEYDLYYLKNKSPLLDIGIVLKTLQIIFTH